MAESDVTTADELPSEEFTPVDQTVEEVVADTVASASLPVLYRIVTLRAQTETVTVLVNPRHEEERERNVEANKPAAVASTASDST
jgi:hypothetical protein